MEYEDENCYIPSGNGCFLNCINCIFKKDLSMEYFDFIQSYKTRSIVMTRCGVPEFCGRYKIGIEIYDDKSKRILFRTVKQRDICVNTHKNHYCVIWRKNRNDAVLNGIEEIDKNFEYVEKKLNEKNSKQRICNRFPKYETKDQSENVFVFGLETYNDQEFAEAYADGL